MEVVEISWIENWSWGLSLIALTIVVHALGVVVVALYLERAQGRVQQAATTRLRDVGLVAAIFAFVGLLLAILHGLEASIWAAAYMWFGAMPSFQQAVLFSLDSMTTRGAIGAGLTPRWQLMGVLEAADGMLLFGISTAFLFAVLERILPILRPHQRPPPSPT
jgi:hypothetical protein